MGRSFSLGLADMMSALMMTFLFIAIAFLAELEQSKKSFADELNRALHSEFDNDLARWQAEITAENVVRFRAPFDIGSAETPAAFLAVLAEFCPRYVGLLSNDRFVPYIEEVRIEGHTSSGWNEFTTDQQAFIKNVELSQRRASSVLTYCYSLQDYAIQSNTAWLERRLLANGRASSQPILLGGVESPELSRRVDFMVVASDEVVRK